MSLPTNIGLINFLLKNNFNDGELSVLLNRYVKKDESDYDIKNILLTIKYISEDNFLILLNKQKYELIKYLINENYLLKRDLILLQNIILDNTFNEKEINALLILIHQKIFFLEITNKLIFFEEYLRYLINYNYLKFKNVNEIINFLFNIDQVNYDTDFIMNYLIKFKYLNYIYNIKKLTFRRYRNINYIYEPISLTIFEKGKIIKKLISYLKKIDINVIIINYFYYQKYKKINYDNLMKEILLIHNITNLPKIKFFQFKLFPLQALSKNLKLNLKTKINKIKPI